MKNDFLGHIDDYYGHFEILYVDGTSDAFYANEELFKKIAEELFKGDCLINIPCRGGIRIEFFSSSVKKISMIFGGRITLKRVAV